METSPSNQGFSSEDERRAEAMMDGSGFSQYDTELRFGDDHDPDRSYAVAKGPARKPRPTGRPAVEISGRDVSRDIANKDALANPVDPEVQHEIYARGRALAQAALKKTTEYGDTEIDRIVHQARATSAAELARNPDNRAKIHDEEELEINSRMRTLYDQRHPQ